MRERRQLSQEVADYVRELIFSGKVRSGEFLRQDAIAEALDTSATPVREGLLALRGEGFVTLEPRRGFMVAPLTTEDIRDMFLAQAVIMSELTARATANLTDDIIEKLKASQEDRAAAAARVSPEGVDHANFDFHRLINLTAKSPKLVWILSMLLRYTPRGFYQGIPGWQEASANDHQMILDAIISRDADAARQAMSAHMQRAGEFLVQYLELSDPWSQTTEADTSARPTEIEIAAAASF